MASRLKQIGASLVSKEKSKLQELRENNSLDQHQLRELLFLPGNYEKYVKPVYAFIESNKDIFTHHNLEDQQRKEMRIQAAKMILAFMKNVKIDIENNSEQLIYACYAGAAFDQGITIKAGLHYFLYTKTILLYQNKEIHKQYLKKAISLDDLGCFGLTEFHHGSFSKGTMTLATYNHADKEWILSTQGSKGMKFWIGAAAEIANMSIIWAQLVVDGKSYGPHPFIVPLRCRKSHKVLPGITIGDCGPKNGLNYIDNGYIILDNVRIPKDNLLGKLGDVDQQGTYQSPFNNIDTRFGQHMSALSGGRGLLAMIINPVALNALTIGFRYACARKQFDNPKKTGQINIIDYPITKLRLIPNLATTILHMAAGNYVALAYFSNEKKNTSPKYIGELHALSASLKALIADSVTNVVAETRTILGGHGYSAYSRFSSLYNDVDVNNTWEGDNNMLLQQTSKFLMRVIPKKETALILDLAFCHAENTLNLESAPEQLRSLTIVEALLQALFRQRYANAKTVLAELLKAKTDSDEAWLHFHPRAGNALALAYANYYVFTIAREKVAAAQSPRVRQFLTNSLCLWAFTLLERERFGSLELRKALQSEILALCEEMTADAVVACDALSPSSFIIGSPFANFQGEGFNEYLNTIYAGKGTFRRVENYREIIEGREKA